MINVTLEFQYIDEVHIFHIVFLLLQGLSDFQIFMLLLSQFFFVSGSVKNIVNDNIRAYL